MHLAIAHTGQIDKPTWEKKNTGQAVAFLLGFFWGVCVCLGFLCLLFLLYFSFVLF